MDGKDPMIDKEALDGIAVTPPPPSSKTPESGAPSPDVREAQDAEHHSALRRDPGDAASKLDVGLDESFPSSDPPAATQPGHADPAPSSGYDEAAEKAREKAKP